MRIKAENFPLILIADDDSVSRRILEKRITEWGYKTIIATDGEKAWAILNKNKVRIAILDWMMPQISGTELCKRVREKQSDTYTYIILVTARGQQEDIIEGLSAGADDYMKKPFDILELKARLQTGKRIISLETQLLQIQLQLRELATKDSLTGLWNRAEILKKLTEEFERARRENITVSTIMLDVDNFKHINDSHGHQVGDIVLTKVAKRLSRNVRIYDTIGRYGGDEILLVLPDTTMENLINITHRLLTSVSKNPVNIQKKRLPITVSIGSASSETYPNITPTALIKKSDEALYEAKRKGRNRFVISK